MSIFFILFGAIKKLIVKSRPSYFHVVQHILKKSSTLNELIVDIFRIVPFTQTLFPTSTLTSQIRKFGIGNIIVIT